MTLILEGFIQDVHIFVPDAQDVWAGRSRVNGRWTT